MHCCCVLQNKQIGGGGNEGTDFGREATGAAQNAAGDLPNPAEAASNLPSPAQALPNLPDPSKVRLCTTVPHTATVSCDSCTSR